MLSWQKYITSRTGATRAEGHSKYFLPT